MPIPFSDIEGLDGLGSAAFLKLERSSDDACCLATCPTGRGLFGAAVVRAADCTRSLVGAVRQSRHRTARGLRPDTMPYFRLIGKSEPTQPGICVEDAHLLLGDWTWEPATSRLVDEFEEGPLGSVDLSLQVLHEPPTARLLAVRRGPGGPAGVAEQFQPPLWKRLMSLLQPPTDLLLHSEGPVEWP